MKGLAMRLLHSRYQSEAYPQNTTLVKVVLKYRDVIQKNASTTIRLCKIMMQYWDI